MNNILDVLLGTSLSRRLLAGYVERGLYSLCLLAAGYAHLQAGTYETQAAKWAADTAPYVVVLVFAYIAQQRMKKAEVTIETARLAPFDTSRASIDADVASMSKVEKKSILSAAAMNAMNADMEKPRQP